MNNDDTIIILFIICSGYKKLSTSKREHKDINCRKKKKRFYRILKDYNDMRKNLFQMLSLEKS